MHKNASPFNPMFTKLKSLKLESIFVFVDDVVPGLICQMGKCFCMAGI